MKQRKLWMRCSALALALCLASTAAFAAVPEPEDGFVHDFAQVLGPEDVASMHEYGQLLWDAFGIKALVITVVGYDGMSQEDYVHTLKEAWALYGEDAALLLLSLSDQSGTVELNGDLSVALRPSERAALLEEALWPAYHDGNASAGVRDAYLAMCDVLAALCMERQAESERARKEKWDAWELAAEQIRIEAQRFGEAMAESSKVLAEELAEAGKKWWESLKEAWDIP